MPVFTECSSGSSAVPEESRVRRPAMRPRTHFFQHHTFPSPEDADPILIPNLNQNPHVSRPSKSNTISSLFLSHFSNSSPPDPTTLLTPKKKGTAAFRGLGCTAGAAQQVSVPAVIRSSAEWEGKRMKKKKNPQHQKRKKESFKLYSESVVGESSNSYVNNGDGNCLAMPDVWCGHGIGFSADAVVGSVDCVVASSATRRNVGGSNDRGKIDGEKIINPREREREEPAPVFGTHSSTRSLRQADFDNPGYRTRDHCPPYFKERPSCPPRRAAVNPETLSFLDSERAFLTSRPEPEAFGSRYCRHVRHPSPDGLAEILMLQNSFIMGGRLDRFSNWRLDIDHMSYEQLLDLGDKIGYVNTGLKENDLGRSVQKVKLSILNELAARSLISGDKKCSVCQEEYEANDELGLLKCGHGFHIQCIKQWLAQKNACPVCKAPPVARG